MVSFLARNKARYLAAKAAEQAAKVARKKMRKGRRHLVRSDNTAIPFLGGANPFPLIWKNAKQHYSETKSYTVGTSGVFGTSNVFNLNSQFDPDQTGVGHQPYARDQFAGLYGRYKVKKVTIDVSFTNPSAGACLGCALLVTNPANGATLAGSLYDKIKERPLTWVGILNEGGGSQIVRFRKTFPVYKLLGVTKQQFDADVGIYDALSGNNPDSTNGITQLKVAICDMAGGSSATCLISVRITMHTDWYQRLTQAQS